MENSVKNSLTIQPFYLQLGLLLLAFLALYYPFITTLVRDWDTNDNYSQGYFIPFVSAFMIWSLREELAAIELKPSNWGLALVALGLLQLFVAKVGSEYLPSADLDDRRPVRDLLFPVRQPGTRAVWLPLVYLIFMIPLPAIIWNRIAFPMQLFASALTEDVVRFIGIPILREGNVLHLAQTSLEVVDACSGLRSLVNILGLAHGLGLLDEQGDLEAVGAVPRGLSHRHHRQHHPAERNRRSRQPLRRRCRPRVPARLFGVAGVCRGDCAADRGTGVAGQNRQPENQKEHVIGSWPGIRFPFTHRGIKKRDQGVFALIPLFILGIFGRFA